MKYLCLVMSIFYSLPCLAQDPDPDLFQTWYLYTFDPDYIPIVISEMNPPIFPYLTISEDLEFIGTGACNSFSGVYSVPYEGALQTIEYTETSDDCGFQNHNHFESDYFGFMQFGFDYEITEDQGGLLLRLYTPLMYWAEYRSYPLSSPDFQLDDVTLYPNPSSKEIFIESKNNPITKIEIFSLLGARMLTINHTIESIDISHFDLGIYLVKIYTEQGMALKKVVKK